MVRGAQRAHQQRMIDARFDAVAGECFDLILANPPYVPGPSPPVHGAVRATDADTDGRAFLNRICAAAPIISLPAGCCWWWCTPKSVTSGRWRGERNAQLPGGGGRGARARRSAAGASVLHAAPEA
jgi:hypothetical protein